MAAKSSPKKRLSLILGFVKERPLGNKNNASTNSTHPGEDSVQWSKGRRRKLARALTRPLERAFSKAGLDIDNDAHWKQLLIWFAWAHFGARGPGAPKKWTPRRLRRLLSDVDEIRGKLPNLTELEYCKRLIKDNDLYKPYQEKSSTLRRALQNAKALDKQAKALSI
jgi:hypothetical protein